MGRLRKFNRNENGNLKKKILIGIYAFLIIGIILTGASYAVYQQEAEVLFINARVGNFKENDIELAIKLDGEDVEVPPSKDNYTVTVDCDNADGSWNGEKWLAEIGNITAGKVKCEVNFVTPEPTLSDIVATSEKTSIALSYTAGGIGISTTCKYGTEEENYTNSVEEVQNTSCNITGLNTDTTYYYKVCATNTTGEVCKDGSIKTYPELSINDVELGDYISVIPTSTSYTPTGEDTGCMNDENCTQITLNPSELNLWRVIKKNDDGTIDAVSEYVSKEYVRIYGTVGYLNYVGALNTIAVQYTNEKYVQSTRHIGYNNQIERCTSRNSSVCHDGSDSRNDIELMKAAGVSISGKQIGVSTTNINYYYPSRGSESGSSYIYYYAKYLDSTGNIYSTDRSHALCRVRDTECVSYAYTSYPVRPVVTLKSTIEVVSGDGKSAETAYRFE